MPNHEDNNDRTIDGQLQSRTKFRCKPFKEDQRRENLLGKILEESSSISLNDPSSQTNAKQVLDKHSKLFELIDELRDVESNINPKLPERDETSWSKFIEWIDMEIYRNSDTQGPPVGSSLFERVGIKTQQQMQSSSEDTTNALQGAYEEYSLVAKVPFKEGQEVFRIPRPVMLTTETAIQDSDLLDFIKKDSIASGMQNVVLVLHLLNEFSKQEQSYWWPYLSILPNKLLPILRMYKSSFASYLACSAHLNEALKMLRAIVRQYCYFYKRLQSTRLPIRKDFTLEYYSWGVSMVCSRNNEVPSSDPSHRHGMVVVGHEDHEKASCLTSSSIQALVPILDMCNHNSLSNQAVFNNEASCLTARQKLSPNQEITINYGNRSSGEFYIHNGFVPDEIPKHDVLPLMVSLKQRQDLQLPLRAKLLKILNMPTTYGTFKLMLNNYENRHKRDPHLTMFLIVYSLTSEELEQVLDSDNQVGLADQLYEHVQHESSEFNYYKNGGDNGSASQDQGPSYDQSEVDQMKRRLAKSLRIYLSRRASISVALIDRAIKELRETTTSDLEHQDKLYLSRLLQHERRIYESYILELQ